MPVNSGFQINDLFDSLFQGQSSHRSILKTDIFQKGDLYELRIEVPGCKKDDIQISLEQGTLKMNVIKPKKEVGKPIRKECVDGTMSRTFYLGIQYEASDIHAKVENGECIITLPSKEKKIEDTRQVITIE